jgi:hypothetical protein
MQKWLTLTWWRYVLDDSRADKQYGNALTRFWCRVNGHSSVHFYNVGGLEPDMRCVECGEDLG